MPPALTSTNTLLDQVIGACYEVSNVLGPGFLEKLYERALFREIHLRQIPAQSQARFPVSYKDHIIGEYIADLVVDDRLILELKCTDEFTPLHMAQCINYLKASRLKIALLVNFHKPKVALKRIVLCL